MIKREQKENTDNLLELNENDIEKIICKQLLNPVNLDNSIFVHSNFQNSLVSPGAEISR